MVSSCSLLPGTWYPAVVYYQVQGIKLLFTTRCKVSNCCLLPGTGVQLQFTTRYRVSSCCLLPGTGCPAVVYYQVQGVQLRFITRYRVSRLTWKLSDDLTISNYLHDGLVNPGFPNVVCSSVFKIQRNSKVFSSLFQRKPFVQCIRRRFKAYNTGLNYVLISCTDTLKSKIDHNLRNYKTSKSFTSTIF